MFHLPMLGSVTECVCVCVECHHHYTEGNIVHLIYVTAMRCLIRMIPMLFYQYIYGNHHQNFSFHMNSCLVILS